ncbi:hypothetical protein D3C84_398510 [compost metagenome]
MRGDWLGRAPRSGEQRLAGKRYAPGVRGGTAQIKLPQPPLQVPAIRGLHDVLRVDLEFHRGQAVGGFGVVDDDFLDQRAVADIDHVQRRDPGVAAVAIGNERSPSTVSQTCHFRTGVGITQIIESVGGVRAGRRADLPQRLGRVTGRRIEQLQRIERSPPRPGAAQREGFPDTVELGIEHPHLPIHQELVAHAVDVGGIGDVPQRRQHTRRHVGVTSSAIGGVDDVYKTVVGVNHEAGIHVGRFGGQVSAVGVVARKIGSGFIRR